MAESSQFATSLINQTVNTFSGGAETVSATDGISLIENGRAMPTANSMVPVEPRSRMAAPTVRATVQNKGREHWAKLLRQSV